MEETILDPLYEASIIPIPKPYKDMTHKKRKLQANITDDLRCKNSQYVERIIHHDQGGFISVMQGFLSIHKSINVILHINKLNNKNHMIISLDA